MTDPTHDPQAQAEAELDELASAYLDGHVSPEEARRVEHDSGLLARVERLRQARDAIRLPDHPVDLERREVAIAAAMAAAGHEPLTAVGSLPAVGDLVEVRARRAARRRWLPAVGIAAAIALAALLVPRLGDDGDRDGTLADASKAETFQDRSAGSGLADDSLADADSADGGGRGRSSTASAEIGAAAPPEAGGDASEGAGAPALPGDTGPAPSTPGGDPAATTTSTTGVSTLTTVDAPHVDLGAFEEGDVSKLREAATAEADAPAAPAAKPTAAVDQCLAQMEGPSQMDGASVIYTAIAKVGEDEVVALVVQLESGRELRARYLDGCERWIDGATLG